MGRADKLRARQEAELAMVELEDELLAHKDDPDRPNEGKQYQDLKLKLRRARFQYRTLRDAEPPEETGGHATVRPAPIKASAGVKRPGGKG